MACLLSPGREGSIMNSLLLAGMILPITTGTWRARGLGVAATKSRMSLYIGNVLGKKENHPTSAPLYQTQCFQCPQIEQWVKCKLKTLFEKQALCLPAFLTLGEQAYVGFDQVFVQLCWPVLGFWVRIFDLLKLQCWLAHVSLGHPSVWAHVSYMR